MATKDFNPAELRDRRGRWTDGAADVIPDWPFSNDEKRFGLMPELPPGGDQWTNTRGPGDRLAVQQYTTGGYRELNRKLRAGETLTGEEQRLHDALRRLIASAPEYPPDKRPVVWRGIDMGPQLPMGAAFPEDRAKFEHDLADWAARRFPSGSTVELGGFQSTSFDTNPPLDASVSKRSPGIVFEIRPRHGAPLWSLDPRYDDESELLLDDQSRYRVIAVLPSVEMEKGDYGDTAKRTLVQLEQI